VTRISISLRLAAAFLGVVLPLRAQQQEMPPELKAINKLYVSLDDEGTYAAANEYLVAHPGDPIALEYRAMALRALGRFDEAVAAVKLITEPTETARRRIKLLLAECLVETKDGAAAAQALVDEVAADDPNGVAARVTRARIYLRTGRGKEATREIQYVRTTSPRLFEGQLLAAAAAEMSGALEEAVALYRPLIAKPTDYDPADPHRRRDAVLGIAGCHMKMQQYGQAESYYQQVVDNFPKWAAARVQLAIAQDMQGRQDKTNEALGNLEKAVALVPAEPDFHARLGVMYTALHRPADAIAQYELMLRGTPPADVQVLADCRLAALHLEADRVDKAKAHADAALALLPDNEEVLAVSGRVREKLGDTAGAEDAYRKALVKNPLLYDTLKQLGTLLAASKDPAKQEEGKKLLERHRKVERYVEMIQYTQREMDLNPYSFVLLTRLASLLNLGGEYELARKWAERSDKVYPNNPATWMQLGFVAANVGDNATALKQFQRVQQRIGKGQYPKLDEYVEKIQKNEPLPLPLGEVYTPAARPTKAAPSSSPAASPTPPKNDPAPAKSGG
jgi:tetratricopeptide (TPR) repeat protein